MRRETDILEFSGDFIHQTDYAVFIKFPEGKMWIPKSQIYESLNKATQKPLSEATDIEGDLIEIHIPEWLAIEKKLI